MHWFIISVNDLLISFFIFFIKIVDMPSSPLLDFDGNLSIIVKTSVSLIELNVNL